MGQKCSNTSNVPIMKTLIYKTVNNDNMKNLLFNILLT